mgnify:CR=1 FL=1
MSLVLGVDGGGTGSRAVLVEVPDSDGAGDGGLPEGMRELARTTGGPAVADGQADGPAVSEVVRVCRMALAEAGVEGPVDALWAGLAGAGRAADSEGVEAGLQEAGLARRVAVGTDVGAAFHASFPVGAGILLVAGTGSVAQARGAQGRTARAGGWGPVVGDEGSGYSMGRSALQAVLQAEDGRGPATRLRGTLLEVLGIGAEAEKPGHEVVAWLATAERRTVARLAPLVVEVAADGDAVASAVVRGAVFQLVAHITALERALGPWPEPPEVTLAGGLLSPGAPLRGHLEEALQGLEVRLVEGSPDAALGAAARAVELAGAGALEP